jgi:hypothetical protein
VSGRRARRQVHCARRWTRNPASSSPSSFSNDVPPDHFLLGITAEAPRAAAD